MHFNDPIGSMYRVKDLVTFDTDPCQTNYLHTGDIFMLLDYKVVEDEYTHQDDYPWNLWVLILCGETVMQRKLPEEAFIGYSMGDKEDLDAWFERIA